MQTNRTLGSLTNSFTHKNLFYRFYYNFYISEKAYLVKELKVPLAFMLSELIGFQQSMEHKLLYQYLRTENIRMNISRQL